jgi:hypothetical protein
LNSFPPILPHAQRARARASIEGGSREGAGWWSLTISGLGAERDVLLGGLGDLLGRHDVRSSSLTGKNEDGRIVRVGKIFTISQIFSFGGGVVDFARGIGEWAPREKGGLCGQNGGVEALTYCVADLIGQTVNMGHPLTNAGTCFETPNLGLPYTRDQQKP